MSFIVVIKAGFPASLLQSSVSHDPSKIILIYWFAAQETFLLIIIIIINFVISCDALCFWETEKNAFVSNKNGL